MVSLLNHSGRSIVFNGIFSSCLFWLSHQITHSPTEDPHETRLIASGPHQRFGCAARTHQPADVAWAEDLFKVDFAFNESGLMVRYFIPRTCSTSLFGFKPIKRRFFTIGARVTVSVYFYNMFVA